MATKNKIKESKLPKRSLTVVRGKVKKKDAPKKGGPLTTMIYAWQDVTRPEYIKFGDHTMPLGFTDPQIQKRTKDYIRKSWGRQKSLFDAGQCVIHLVEDVTDYAKRVGKNYQHAKIDDYIARKSKLDLHRLGADIYQIDIEQLKKMVNGVVNGVHAAASYKPHKFQQTAISKAVDFYANSGRSDFLLDCVMRFGKCFTSYKIAKEIGATKILVLTGAPKVADGWHDDIDHVDFPDCEFIDSRFSETVEFTGDGMQVVFGSFQGSDRPESRLDKVLSQDIDLLIIDEAHTYLSPSAIEFCKEKLSAKQRLWVSGTPMRQYESGMFDGNTDTYQFTLLDLMREKREVQKRVDAGEVLSESDLRYLEFPDIQFVVASYPELGDKVIGEEGLNMKALLSSKDGVPNYPDEVNALCSSLLDPTTRNSPFNMGGRELKYSVNPEHVWMAVPPGRDETKPISVAAAKVLEEAISKHPVLGDRYRPLAIRGDKNQYNVMNHITLAKMSGMGTINISCRSLNTGTKFPDLNTIVFLSETSSAADFWQTVGRAMQPHANKKSITVILYSSQMMVNMANKMVEYSASNNQTHHELMTEFLSMMPIFIQGGPKLKEMTIDEMYEQLTVNGSVTKAFGDNEVLSVNFDSIVSNNVEFFKDIPDGTQTIDKTKIGDGDRGKNANITRQAKAASKKINTREKVRMFLANLGSIIAASLYLDNISIKSVNDLQKMNQQTVDGVIHEGTYDIVSKLLALGALNVGVLDRKISAFYNVVVAPHDQEDTDEQE